MVNYENSKIYQIVCYTTGKVYIGSTCEPTLARRLTKHRNDYKRFMKGTYNYVYSFEVIKENNYKIELIKYFSCETKEQLSAEEGKYIRNMDCVNKQVAGRTSKEWRQDNKGKKIDTNKQGNKFNQYRKMIRLYKKTFMELCNIDVE